MAKSASAAMLKNIHPDAAFILVGRGLLAEDAEMEKNIGRFVKFIHPEDEGAKARMGSLKWTKPFKIIGIQKIWDGSKAYRVQCTAYDDSFGCPAKPDEIRFLRFPPKVNNIHLLGGK